MFQTTHKPEVFLKDKKISLNPQVNKTVLIIIIQY